MERDPTNADHNARALSEELRWFSRVLETRLQLHFERDCDHASITELDPPDLGGLESPYVRFLRTEGLLADAKARLLLVLSLVPHVRPHLLDALYTANPSLSRPFSQFGGVAGEHHPGFIPTGETALFLLADGDLAERFRIQGWLGGAHPLFRERVLRLEPAGGHEPAWSGMLTVDTDRVAEWTTGWVAPPSFGPSFPAHRITTTATWDDLVLEREVRSRLEEIRAWIRSGRSVRLRWGLEHRVKPGFRALFYGPSGTGKTMTAALIAADTDREIYRIDLSMVVSKYIGETEKNLARVFDHARGRDWILFFDEADALFGKRTQVKDSHDRFANQQIAYLLQRIEDHDGVVLLSTNLRENIDAAFTRRFQAVVHFPMPTERMRLELWRRVLDSTQRTAPELDLGILARHPLSCGAIVNAAHYAALLEHDAGREQIRLPALKRAIRWEMQKEGRCL